MAKDVLIQVTIYDDERGEVSQQLVVNYSGEYGWEIKRTFEQLGDKVAKIIDQTHE